MGQRDERQGEGMIIKIKHRYTGAILFQRESTSLKLCVEAAVKAKTNLGGADLRGAYLGGADLGGADLGGADLGGANLGGADLGDAYLGGADLRDAYLGGADLGGAYLGGADLRGADLGCAYLGCANLGDVKSYVSSHYIFAQLIINATIKFTVHEQEMAFRIFTLRLCWDSIHKEYGKKIVPVFKKLAKLGWDEYLKEWHRRCVTFANCKTS
jgi:hypothetical protein